MEIKIIRDANKYLNAISIISLSFGFVSVLLFASINSDSWLMNLIRAITLSLLALGFISIVLSFYLLKKIKIKENNIEILKINSTKSLVQINSESDLEYLGNSLVLKNGQVYEIHRNQILSLIKTINKNEIKIEIEFRKQKFYLQSPKEILKFLLSLA